jgi:hypothetical protein
LVQERLEEFENMI